MLASLLTPHALFGSSELDLYLGGREILLELKVHDSFEDLVRELHCWGLEYQVDRAEMVGWREFGLIEEV